MWATLAMSAALGLAPAQAGGLELKNVRVTHGILGQERKDSKDPKLLPGDHLIVMFDIDGLKVKDDGRVLYSMGMELTRKGAAKAEFSKAPEDLEAVIFLGGSRISSFARTEIGLDTTPGTYTLTVTVTDRGASPKVTRKLVKTFEVVKPPVLGFVRVVLAYETGQPAPPVAVVGQKLLLGFSLVGFQTDPKTKQPNVTIDMTIKDEKGKETLKKPFKGDVKKLAMGFTQVIPFDPIALDLNQPGTYTVTIKATDNLAKKKSVEHTMTLRVLDPTSK